MSITEEIPDYILAVVEAPNENLERKWDSLHGIDNIKRLVLGHCLICLDRIKMESWCERHYPNSEDLPQLLNYELGFSGKTLLAGDSGTGKTQFAEGLADALAKEIGKLYLIKAGLLRSKYVGHSSLYVKKTFSYAKEKAKGSPVLLFIDEFDSVAPNRDNSQMHEEVKAAVNTLLEEIDRVTPSDRVLIVAATNLLEQAVDFAADRRFDMVVNFKRPTFFQRLNFLTILLRPFRIDSEGLNLLARKTENYTQADMKKVLKLALNRCLTYDRMLTANDLLYSLKYVRPTRSYGGGKSLD